MTLAGSRRTSTTTRARSPSSTRGSAIIHGLLRRYGDDETAVIEHGERAAVEVERLRGLDEERARRQKEDARLLDDVASGRRGTVGGASRGGRGP